MDRSENFNLDVRSEINIDEGGRGEVRVNAQFRFRRIWFLPGTGYGGVTGRGRCSDHLRLLSQTQGFPNFRRRYLHTRRLMTMIFVGGTDVFRFIFHYVEERDRQR